VAIDPGKSCYFSHGCQSRLASAALVPSQRLGYWRSGRSRRWPLEEVIMVDPARRAKLLRELEQEFVPDYDATNIPSADKRAAYALEHIAFRASRIDQSLSRIAAALESLLAKE
jgi:hypothetical protein